MLIKHGFFVTVLDLFIRNKKAHGFFHCKEIAVEAARFGQASCKNNSESVVLKPNFNEINKDNKHFFREWRSYCGLPFKEIFCFYKSPPSEDAVYEVSKLVLPDLPSADNYNYNVLLQKDIAELEIFKKKVNSLF